MREQAYLPAVLVAASSAAVVAGGLYWASRQQQQRAAQLQGADAADAAALSAQQQPAAQTAAPAQPVLHGRITSSSGAAACKPPTQGQQPGAAAAGGDLTTPVRGPRAAPAAAGMSPATPEATAEQRVSSKQQLEQAAEHSPPGCEEGGPHSPTAGAASSPPAAAAPSEQLQAPRQPRLRSSAMPSPAAAPTSPTSGSGDVGSSGPSLAQARHHRCFNTAVQAPSLNVSVSTAAVARSLGLQYAATGSGNLTGALGSGSEDGSAPHADADSSSVASSGDEEGQAAASLASACAALCVKHCTRLQQATGDSMALDIGCGTGGCCFELARSFTHVLGIDADPLNMVAAKEMKAKGELHFTPVAATAADAGAAAASAHVQEQLATCVARVPHAVDRERVLFWTYALPDLPPKMSLVDAVLVEDVEGRLGGAGLQRVCEQLRGLLKPGGVAVVVLGPDAAAGPQAAWLAGAGLVHVADEGVTFPAPSHAGGVQLQDARGSVWRQPELL